MNGMHTASSLELWGGVECTVCRVDGKYIDQIALTGHDSRLQDVDRIAALGVRMLRYPVLWERTAPDSLASANWTWADERLARIRAHGVVPIVGLMHHGSGPAQTSLMDPNFPSMLGSFAAACAERYPWMEWVTPVNEPLTTARFSGLYGHWHPHLSDDRSFVRILLNECEAIRVSMARVREFAPGASLVQTEDLGYTHASDGLSYQADFENERRWLTWDLLCGHVVPGHAMYRYLIDNGATEAELDDFAASPCPPDVIGADYYVTSERFLDSDIEQHPIASCGGNGRDRYADVEVARARPEERRGAAALLQEAWERYGIPIAITEAHLSCDDERERVRWLVQLWNAALTARTNGCDVRAVTAWALFGSCGWDALSTRPDGRYEAGAFDICNTLSGEPRETAVARAIRDLAACGWCGDEALAAPGWWDAQTTAQTPEKRAEQLPASQTE